MIIDIDRLRCDLINYFGTATMIGFPMARIDMENVKRADNNELIKTAIDNGFIIKEYKIAKLDD